jgi:hypothetical protein
MLGVPIFHEDSSRGGGMRSIAFIWAVAVISAALAGRRRAGEDPACPEFDRHQLHDELQLASGKLPNHLCRGDAASRFYRLYQQRSNAHSQCAGHHPVLVELQFGPPHPPVELCAAIAVAIMLFCRGSLL